MNSRSIYERVYRRIIFPMLSGRPVGRRTASYLRQAEAAEWWSESTLRQHQLNELVRLTEFALTHSPWYRDYANVVGRGHLEINTIEDLSRWPVIDRETVVNAGRRFFSETITSYTSGATGGSTGQPMRFRFNADSAQRRAATAYRGYNWAGAGFGAKTLALWGTQFTNVGWKRRAHDWLATTLKRQTTVSCFEFNEQSMAACLDRMQRFRPHVIHAYTNPLFEFARYLRATNQEPPRPRSIVVGAERLHDFQRSLIESTFHAPIFETYGCREFLLIGAECDRHEGLHLSSDTLLVEILDEDGEPTPDGHVGNVVITDLTNLAMPLIRFANGDRAVAGFGRCSCGRSLPVLKSVEGRVIDLIHLPDGQIITGLVFPHLMKDYPRIKRFRVTQTAPWIIRLEVVADPPIDEATRNDIERNISQMAGPRLQIEWSPVDTIPLTRTGKHQVVIGLDAGHKPIRQVDQAHIS